MKTEFATVVGYVLGILVVLVISGVCLKPLKKIAVFLLSSAGGILVALGVNFVGEFWGVHIGINPVTAIIIGIFGIPGVIMLLLGQIFY